MYTLKSKKWSFQWKVYDYEGRSRGRVTPVKRYRIYFNTTWKICIKSLDFCYNIILSHHFNVQNNYLLHSYTAPVEGILYYAPNEGIYFYTPDEVAPDSSGFNFFLTETNFSYSYCYTTEKYFN